MEDRICFVQFIHPGLEHKPDNGLMKHWNTDSHRRKFLKTAGSYVSAGEVCDGEIIFWGEWEPESKAISTILGPIPKGPHFIYEPYYVLPDLYQGLQNTDPFVYGEQFHYTVCQQRRNGAATQLNRLLKGSVILFGSCQEKSSFVLDTVFVVDHWIDHHRGNYQQVLTGMISREYSDVTISPWYQESVTDSKSCVARVGQETWRLYFGASFKNPIQRMFSYFPCQSYELGSKGFARPEIKLPGVITDNLNQGFRLTELSNLDEMSLLWNKVAEQIKNSGLQFGVHADLPERHD